MMYHLIFKAAGYEGWYTDYSSYHYPPKRYRGRPVTEEEIAVAAYFLWQNGGQEHGHDVEHWHLARNTWMRGIETITPRGRHCR